jgi:SAM-dependent methyltransferase
MQANPQQLKALYEHRFDDQDRKDKAGVWQALCSHFFSRHIRPSDTVLDVGAGYCEFINHIQAARRIAVDANPELRLFAAQGVEPHSCRADELSFLADHEVDVAFSSNFFEHLSDKAALLLLVKEIHRVLKPGGRLLVMGPNVKYLPGDYWDWYDHHIPLTEKSVGELLQLGGFEIDAVHPRFLPYTVKSRLPKWPWLVRAYLLMGPLSFPLFGKQFLVIGRKR